jgi:hypothetical protein
LLASSRRSYKARLCAATVLSSEELRRPSLAAEVSFETTAEFRGRQASSARSERSPRPSLVSVSSARATTCSSSDEKIEEGTVNGLVEARLLAFAESTRSFLGRAPGAGKAELA